MVISTPRRPLALQEGVNVQFSGPHKVEKANPAVFAGLIAHDLAHDVGVRRGDVGGRERND
jgi:hypothetical protein